MRRPGPGGERGQAHPRQRSVLLGALLAAAVVAASVLAANAGLSADAPSSSASSAPVPRTALPAGWQRVSSLGVEADAPGSWGINAWSECTDTTPPAAEITRAQGFTFACGRLPGSPTIASRVDIRRPGEVTTNAFPAVDYSTPTTRTTITRGGAAATLSTYRRPAGHSETVISFPGRDVEVAANSSDPLLVARIIASVWPVTVDSVGCLTDLPPSPSWNRRTSGPGVHLGRPASITVCYYPTVRNTGQQVLAASMVLTGVLARTAATTIDSARPGAVPDDSTCLPGSSADQVVLHVRRTDGTTVDAWVKIDGCTDRWVATPTGVSQSTRAQAAALLKPLRINYGTGGSLPQR